MTPLRRTVRYLVVALVSALALTACTTLPRSGPVTASDPDLPVTELGLAAPGPSVGAEPAQIVQGFLQASAAGLTDDFAGAREFLAGPVQATWDPMAQVRVFDADPAVRFTTTDAGGVRVRVPAEASLDSDGRYTESVPGTTIEADFTLARTDGEWRIIALDDGVLLSVSIFGSLYAQRPLYFLSQDRAALVPDVRWYPRRNLATSLVRGLLEGPSEWLTPAVSTAMPTGTGLTVESVVVEDGIAQVDLSNDALAAGPDDRALAVAQIEATLRDVPSVRDTRVTVGGGATYEVLAEEPNLQRNAFVSSTPVVVSQGLLAEYSRELRVLPGAENMAGVEANHPAVGYGDDPIMVLLDGTDRLVTAPTETAEPVTLLQGADLVPPSVDRLGWVWTSPANSTGSLRATRVNGIDATVSAPWLSGGELRSVRISRDGSRAVVVWERNAQAQVSVAAVIREADGTPAALGEPVRLGDLLTDATDATWVDEVTVAVLGTSGDSADPAVHLLPLGGPTTQMPVVEDAVSVAAARGERSVVVGTSTGLLYEFSGGVWRRAVGDVRDPALPG